MSLKINSKVIFIDNFVFLNLSLDNLLKNLSLLIYEQFSKV